MDWLGDNLWLAWLIAALLLVAIELASADLILLMLGVGALGGMAAALATDAVIVQFIVFAAVALAALALVRPRLLARLHRGPDLKTGIDRLVGQTTVAVRAISAAEPARIVIDGEDWLARPADPDATIAAGTPVSVTAIRGATAYVSPLTKE